MHMFICIVCVCVCVCVCRDKDDESLQKSVSRVLSVWQERKVFDHEMIRKLKVILSESTV